MTRLSSMQYTMIRAFVEKGTAFHMPIEQAQEFDQRPFRSMLVRKWITYHPGRGFCATKEGREAWREFLSREIWRKNPSLPLTCYFDATQYGLKAKVTNIAPRKGAAA
jgi:hypothetical protein